MSLLYQKDNEFVVRIEVIINMLTIDLSHVLKTRLAIESDN